MTKAAKVAKASKRTLAYMDPALSVDRRVEDLLGRMTLDEKVYQLGSFAPWISKRSWEQIFLDKAGKFSPAKARRYIPKRGIGQLTCGLHNVMPRKAATIANGLQRVVAAHTRLGIPLLIHDEALHGLTAQDSTSFPQSIGLAATWNTKLVRRIAAAIGGETRSRGIHQVLAPTINIARDVRCGRTEETYGEDTHLASRMAVAFVKGVQGEGVAATLKHYVANFVGDGGRDSGEIHLSERYLREACFPAFEAAVREGGAMSVMSSYNAVDGVPCTSNRWLLVDVLRGEWGFRGYTVSDYVSVEQICTGHRTAESIGEAGKAAVEAGLDVELPHIVAYEKMLDLAKRGEVSAEAIDTSVRNVLRVKFMLGLFENPGADPAAAARVANCPAHRKLALDAAREAIVLLKNEKAALPLGKHVRSIAVIGPNADVERLGGYSTAVTKVTTVLGGLRARTKRGVDVRFAEGCKPDGDSKDGFAKATALAARCDVAVLVMGNCLETEGENRDRSNLDLPGVQEDLIREVAATGTPVVVVLITGGAVTMTGWLDKAGAVLLAWYPGQEGGYAVADVLLGESNPSGRLPISLPRTCGQLPLYYSYKPDGRGHDYNDLRGEPALFPFGFGLSYTTFKYSNLKVAPRAIAPGGRVKVAVDVANTGSRTGDEVVQLYLQDLYGSVSRPNRELKAFRRISLRPGQTKTVEFTLGEKQLRFLDRHMKYIVEPGTFEVTVGGNSLTGLRRRFKVR